MILLLQFNKLDGQTSITYTITQQPCNPGGVPDGVVQLTFNGFSNPIYLTISLEATLIKDTIYSGNTYTLNNWNGYNTSFSANSSPTVNDNIFFMSPPSTYIESIPAVACPTPATVSLAISGGSPPYLVEWKDYSNGALVATGNPVTLANDVYDVRITDALGCVTDPIYDCVVVFNQSSIVASVVSTNASCTNGTASLTGVSGGLAPYSYLWNNGANTPTLSGLSAGNYSVVITDAQGCTGFGWTQITQTIAINTNSTTVPSTCQFFDGAATAFASGGTPPYTFLWENGMTTQTISNVQSDFYSFIATDANGCTGTGFANVTSSNPITVTYTASPTQCTSPTGSATLMVNGGTPPYSINWSVSPLQTGFTLSGVPDGNYAFTVTDANGCSRNGIVTVPIVSTINVYPTITNTPCSSASGSISLAVSGSSPPFTYNWNNGSTSSSISNLVSGIYTCTITDAIGCDFNITKVVNNTQILNLTAAVTNASCLFANDGAIALNTTGGTPPYSYSCGSPNYTGLSTQTYTVSVLDANGCYDVIYPHVGYNAANNNCYCTISGYSYEDLNANCIKDAGENGINHVMIGCNNGIGYTYTDATGYYEFKVPSGSYVITENPQGIVNLSPCQNNNQVVNAVATSGCVIPVDFGNVLSVVHDVSLHTINWTLPILGNVYTHSLLVENIGSLNEPGLQLGFAHDGQLQFQNSSPLNYTQQNPGSMPDWYSILSGMSLSPGTFLMNYNYFYVPINVPLGTEVILKDTAAYAAPMSNWFNENSPWNNVEYYPRTVVGPYDPNFKEVFPPGFGPDGQIEVTDTLLRYVIHFQNLGNWYAQHVVVTDTLDPDLDWTTLRPGWSNHNYTLNLSSTGVATFRFDNIHLPPKNWGELASIGIFEYTIEAENNVQPGTQITNSANIYFDFNDPVITNTATSTYVLDVSAETKPIERVELSVYPNPAGENVMLSFDASNNENTVVALFDLSGKQMLSQKFATSSGKNFINLDLRSVSNGMYFVKVQNGEKEMVKKLSVAK